ncbi:MAG: RT0821/Lpp0805 family surface protein [Gammaproteobacteria bacterium]
MRAKNIVSFILLFAATMQVAGAQNINFLQRGPVAYLDDVDKQILTETFNKALAEVEDGESVAWRNPDSGSEGTIEILDTHEDYGTTCRTVRTATSAGGRDGGGIYRLCLADDETWQFAPRRRQQSG